MYALANFIAIFLLFQNKMRYFTLIPSSYFDSNAFIKNGQKTNMVSFVDVNMFYKNSNNLYT